MKDMYQAEVNLSEKVTVDSACYYDRLTKDPDCFKDDALHTCVLSSARSRKRASVEELDDVVHVGGNATDQGDLTVYMIAKILGKHFKAGEWGSRRCGSVVTTIYRGRSRYCVVKRFIEVQSKYFACV